LGKHRETSRIELNGKCLTFVSRYVAQAAKAENTGAVKTHTVSTDSGMFIAFTNLHKQGI
jgi:hypothetical protein